MYIMPVLGFVLSKRKLIETTCTCNNHEDECGKHYFFYTDSMVAVLKYKRFFGKRGSKKFLKVSGTNLFAVGGGGVSLTFFP